MNITVSFDDRELKRAMRLLSTQQLPGAMSKAINRTLFEMRDAEAAHVGQIFEFAGPSTKAFLTRSSGSGQAFRFKLATPARLEASLFPAPRTADILEPHAFGETIRGGDEGRLTIEGQLATPVELKRTGRGRVRGRRSKSFVRGRAVLQRVGRGASSKLRVLFALVPQAKLEPRFEFFRTAREAAQRTFVTKAKEEFEKAVRR